MKKILMSLFTIAIVGTLIGSGMVAVFTDTEKLGGNTFTTGTVNLTLAGGNPLSFAVGNMAPGDRVNGTITVTNAGTLDLRYAMTTTVGGPNPGLAGQLQASINDTPPGPLAPPPLYSGALNAAAFGSAAQGQDPGDRVLLVGQSEVLYFQVSLPLGAGTSWQGMSCAVTFNFHAEQTANNP